MSTLADVTLSFHSLGEIDLDLRAEVAAAAGFRKIGLSIRRTRSWLEAHPLAELQTLLDRHGLRVGELEVLAPLRGEPDQHDAFAIGLARELNCPLIQLNGPFEGTIAEGVQRLRALGDRGADDGITFSLEFLPWTNIPTAAAGAQIVAAVDRPNVGICVDAWHLYRSGGEVSDLAELWPLVASVQLDDGPLLSDWPDDLREDCVRYRRLPGLGEFDLLALLSGAERNALGYSLSLEVMSEELKTKPLGEVGALLAASTTAILDTVREAVDV